MRPPRPPAGPPQPVPDPRFAQDAWEIADEGWGTGEPEINVLEYLHLLWNQRWLILAVFLVCLVLAGAWSFTRPKRYTAVTKLTVERSPRIMKDAAASFYGWWEMDRIIADQVEILKSRRLAKRVVEKLGLAGTPGMGEGDPAQRLLASLQVKPGKESDVITVSFTAGDPQRAAEWLNVYVQELIALNIEDNLERTRKVYEVIQSKLEPLRRQVETSEQALLSFKERKDALLFADQDKNVITEQVNTLTSEYAKAKAERIQLETKIAALRQLRAERISEASFPEVLDDPTIQALTQQRNQLEVELAEKLRTYKEGHPVIKDLRSRLAGIDGRIEAQIKTILTALQTDYEIKRRREQSLYANIQKLRDQSIELSKQTMEYERLKRQYEQNKTFYEEMLARSKEVDISSTAGMNNLRVIDPAHPPKQPSSPNIQRSLALGGVLGLMLGVGLVFLLDYADQTVRTPDDVERYLGLDTLAVIQEFKDEAGHAIRETYQSLRTAVMLASREEGCQVVMVTSAVPGEGKTTVCYNLARALAASGDRVLLVDSDLRKPRIHRIVKAKNVRGLTSIVLGERDLKDVIHTLADIPKLDIVTSGPLPPNPPELFSKPSFKGMLERAGEEYTWVLLDTPPIASVTDPVICSQLASMVVLVVEYGSTKRKIVQEALRQLARAGARTVGAVLNKVSMERDHYYTSYYSSYYYYRYHYGESESGGTPRLSRKGAS